MHRDSVVHRDSGEKVREVASYRHLGKADPNPLRSSFPLVASFVNMRLHL